ncbi:MAG: TRAP transporter substrate-binding protein [Thermodesulfobacteriota bacterium]
MKKRALLGAAVLGLALLLAANLAAAAEFTLKFANPVAKDHSWGRAAEEFKKMVAEATKNRVEVQVHHSGALGKIRETLEMAKAGTVDLVLCGSGHLTAYVPELGIPVLPYLWKDREIMFQVLDGRFGDYIGARMEEKGFVSVAWWDNGFRHVSNNTRPVQAPGDLKGLKLRTLPTKVHVAFFKALGASPTPIDFTELFQAMQQGVVDGQENPPAMVYFNKFQEVQKFYSLTAHVNEPGNLVMSKVVYDKLPKDVRLAVMMAAEKATIWQREATEKDNNEFLKKLKEVGMKVNEVPKETIAEFRKTAQTVYAEALKDLGPGAKEMVDLLIWSNK